jgi:hypothetical protein
VEGVAAMNALTDRLDIAVLCVGIVGVDQPHSGIAFYHADTANDALLAIRMFKIDIAVAALDEGRVDVCGLMRRASQLQHRCHWLCFTQQPSSEEELVAKALGAFVIAGAAPTAQLILQCIAPATARSETCKLTPRRLRHASLIQDLSIRSPSVACPDR